MPHSPCSEWHRRLSGNYSNGSCGKNTRNGSKVFLAVSNAVQQQEAKAVSMGYMGSISIDCQKRAHRAELENLFFYVIQCEFNGSYFFLGGRG